jgi:small subunit ribosomal protein S20
VAHSRQAKKRWRQNLRQRERNRPVRTRVRSAARTARAAITSGSGADEALRDAISVIDRASKHNVIHRNAAARHKSRLMRLSNKTAAAPVREAPKRTRRAAAKAEKPAPPPAPAPKEAAPETAKPAPRRRVLGRRKAES